MNTFKSYAKINLILDVLYKRDDGYHQIRTVFQEIDLCDELTLVPSSKIDIKMSYSDTFPHPTTIKQESNIAYRAACLLQSRYNINEGVEIHINKNIPISAGLGGGSSNAAAVIKGLSHMWNLQLSIDEMKSFALELGSDVPYFLLGNTALGEGRGEELSAIESISIDKMLLVKPKYGISSKTAYSLWKDEKERKAGPLFRNGQFSLTDIRNDLQKAVKHHYPEIDFVIEYITNNGGVNSVLSGSGSTVVGFYDDESVLERHYHFFKQKGYWVFKTKTRS